MDQAAFLIELADDLRELLSRSAGQNDIRTLISKASGCYGAHAGTGACPRWKAPRQNSSGGKERLGRVSKMGNRYLRKLLVVGAHAVLYHRKSHEDAMLSWAKKHRLRDHARRDNL
jgi:hypothetical protein